MIKKLVIIVFIFVISFQFFEIKSFAQEIDGTKTCIDKDGKKIDCPPDPNLPIEISPDPTLKKEVKEDTGTRLKDYKPLAPIPGLPETISANINDPEAFTLPSYIRTVIRILIGVIGILSVVMIIVGGIQLMSTDSFSGKETGKETATNAIKGLILALVAVLLLRTLNPQLTKLGFSDNEFTEGVGIEVDGISIPKELYEKESQNPERFSASDLNLGPGLTKEKGEKYIKYFCSDINKANQHDAILKSAAQKTGVSCNLIKAIMIAESGCGKNLQPNSDNAAGIMQVIPQTITFINNAFKQTYKTEDRMVPSKAAELGGYYQKELEKIACNGKPNNDVCDANKVEYRIAAYNTGPGRNVKSKLCSTPKTRWECENEPKWLKEPRDYVDRVGSMLKYFEETGKGC